MVVDFLTLAEKSSATLPARKRILIVEDDPGQAETLAYRLSQQGFEPIMAGTGRRAIALARSEQPALVILDIRLPDASGLDVCRELNDNPLTCTAPIIMVSGMEGPDIVRATRSAGSQYFVRKPYDPSALLVLICHALDDVEAW